MSVSGLCLTPVASFPPYAEVTGPSSISITVLVCFPLSVLRPIAASDSFWVCGSSRSCRSLDTSVSLLLDPDIYIKFLYLRLWFLPRWCDVKFASPSNHFAHSLQYHCPNPGRSSTALVFLYWSRWASELKSAWIWSRSRVYRLVFFLDFEPRIAGMVVVGLLGMAVLKWRFFFRGWQSDNRRAT